MNKLPVGESNEELIETAVIIYLQTKLLCNYQPESVILTRVRSLATSFFDSEEHLQEYIIKNFSPGSEKYSEYFPCQVSDLSARVFLTCEYTESGGKQCERLEPHTDNHYWTDHLVLHERYGNGYLCKGIGNDLSVLRS